MFDYINNYAKKFGLVLDFCDTLVVQVVVKFFFLDIFMDCKIIKFLSIEREYVILCRINFLRYPLYLNVFLYIRIMEFGVGLVQWDENNFGVLNILQK